jgi:hypothetical protein
VYCAAEGIGPTLPHTGMPDGGAPRAVSLDDAISIVVSDVPAATYSPAVLDPKLADLDWVGAAGGAHHAVLDALADAGAVVLPFRLFTLFSSEMKAVETLRRLRPAMAQAFARVRGKQEWILRIGKPDPARADAAPAPTAAPASGTTFLQAKADARREAAARAIRIKEDAAAIFEALEQLSDAAKTRPVDGEGTLLLDAAFLIPASRVEAVHETLTRRADRLLRDGCPVSLTGPWPAYSFASMDANHE